MVWESEHGPIPEGHSVIFRNGDKQDIRLENLELVSKGELMKRNTVHRLPKDLANVCLLKGALTRQIKRSSTREKPD